MAYIVMVYIVYGLYSCGLYANAALPPHTKHAVGPMLVVWPVRFNAGPPYEDIPM